jgi:hypothetical protein
LVGDTHHFYGPSNRHQVWFYIAFSILIIEFSMIMLSHIYWPFRLTDFDSIVESFRDNMNSHDQLKNRQEGRFLYYLYKNSLVVMIYWALPHVYQWMSSKYLMPVWLRWFLLRGLVFFVICRSAIMAIYGICHMDTGLLNKFLLWVLLILPHGIVEHGAMSYSYAYSLTGGVCNLKKRFMILGGLLLFIALAAVLESHLSHRFFLFAIDVHWL